MKIEIPKDERLFKQGGVSHCGLAIFIKKYSRQKMNYGNSNSSPCRNIIFQKSSERNQNPSRYYNSPISSSNTSQNIIFQKSSYKNRPFT
jgi:hypothetical protein